MTTGGGYYAVKVGRKKGIYFNWEECKLQVSGYPNSIYKKFKTKFDAINFMNNDDIGCTKITPRMPSSIDSPSIKSLGSVTTTVPFIILGEPKPLLCNYPKLTSSISSPSLADDYIPIIFCKCDIQSLKQRVQKEGDNKGKDFFSCKYRKCNFFQWAHDIMDNGENNTNTNSSSTYKNDPEQLSLNYSDHYLNAMNREDTIIIYIDGSCPNNVDVASRKNYAGFGCVAIKNDKNISDKDKKCLCKLYGPVELDFKSKYFIGATLGSNNTGELTAFGEALLWIQSYIPGSNPIILRYDSEYAAKSTLGIFNGEKNKELVLKVQQLYKDVLLQRKNRIVKSSSSSSSSNLKDGEGLIILKHVKAHSGDYFNDLVDQLAKDGALGQICNEGRYKINSPLIIETQNNLMKTILNNQKKTIDKQIKNSSLKSYENSISNQIIKNQNKELDIRLSFNIDSKLSTEAIQIDLTDDANNNNANNRVINTNKGNVLNKRNIQQVDLTIKNSNNEATTTNNNKRAKIWEIDLSNSTDDSD